MPPTPAPEAITAWQALVSLMPVIVGGFIGIAAGLSTTAFGRFLQSREDKKALRRAKLETVVSHVFEIEHWAKRVRHQYLYDSVEVLYEVNPTSKIVTLTAIHFPNLHSLAAKLNTAADHYELALLAVKTKMLEAAQKAMTDTQNTLTAANPADPTIADRMKLAANAAKLAAGADIKPIEEPFREMLVTSKALLTEAKKIATNL